MNKNAVALHHEDNLDRVSRSGIVRARWLSFSPIINGHTLAKLGAEALAPNALTRQMIRH